MFIVSSLRSINDVQRFLEVKRSKASTVLDLFTTSLEAQRMRLKSYCERLMFKDPLAYGREAKDILWKKCYYDVINTAKLLRSVSRRPKRRTNVINTAKLLRSVSRRP
jgi:hypothetical protein